jgi:uncharacterized protein (DUF1330 family)
MCLLASSMVFRPEREGAMAAYLIIQSTIADEKQYQKYREAVVPLITKFAGKFLIRGGKSLSQRAANVLGGL